MRAYKYNKQAGALQEAMAPQASSASMAPPADSYVAAHATYDNLPALLPAGGKPPSDGRDPHRHRPRFSMFFYAVEEGQRILVTSRSGAMEVVEGPRRLWRPGRRFSVMDHYVAHPGEFLIVRFRDGRQEHLSGPAHCWLDPRVHLSVDKEDAVQISNKEAVVVYNEKGDDVRRRIVHGPATFVPGPGEWLHTFSWHGSRGGLKVPNALVFQKLWLMPDQMYHDVPDVRTADDAVLTIKLMLFFELVDIDKMLVSTHDPIGDFINSATSDVVEYLSRHGFEAFKANAEQLNAVETYRQLVTRAEQVGYRINKVVYRGYGAPPSLQKMHDEATQSRTRLQLERATQQQAQELEDLKLERDLGRAAKHRAEAAQEVEHRLRVADIEREAELRADAQRRQAERAQRESDEQLRGALAAEEDARRLAHVQALGALGVDLTRYLTQGRPDQIIELRGGEGASNHLHMRARRREEG